MSAPLSLIVFDMDGTLIDSQAAILDAMEAAFASVGRPAPASADILGIVGLSLETGIARLAPDLDAAAVAPLAAAYRARFLARRAETGGEAASPPVSTRRARKRAR
jgi:phosphoglycolate phosphatase